MLEYIFNDTSFGFCTFHIKHMKKCENKQTNKKLRSETLSKTTQGPGIRHMSQCILYSLAKASSFYGIMGVRETTLCRTHPLKSKVRCDAANPTTVPRRTQERGEKLQVQSSRHIQYTCHHSYFSEY